MTTGPTEPELRTERLLMRGWTDADREPFAAMNADPVVMEHFPHPLSRAESDALVERVGAGFAEHGFGWWALETLEDGRFIGFTGLSVPRFRVPWMDRRHQPVVEVGWRLVHDAWHRGYASEAARSALSFAFGTLGLPEVVSFTTTTNLRSQAVMQRLGMSRLTTYQHPIDGGPPLPSVAYLLAAADWRHGPGPRT